MSLIEPVWMDLFVSGLASNIQAGTGETQKHQLEIGTVCLFGGCQHCDALLLARIGGLIPAFENLVEFYIFPENAVFNDNILNLPKIFGLVLETQEIYLCDHFNHKVDCQQ